MSNSAIIMAPNKSHIPVYFCIFILFLTSMDLWIAWNGRGVYINAFLGVVLWFLIKKEHVKLNTGDKNVIILLSLLFSYACLNFPHRNIFGIIGGLVSYIFPVSYLVLLNESDQKRCLQYIVKWFAILMVPAIITYVLVQTVGLPSLGILKVSDNPYQGDWYLYRENYIFCTMYSLKETTRFNGPFNEPGHLGMMCAFLLLADGYNFKKKSTWVLLFALLMTVSLAGYMLVFVGYLFTKFHQRKINLISFVLFLSVIAAGYYFATSYNEGENIINEKIVERLAYDEEKGIVGNNRVFGDIHLYFLDMFSDAKLFFLGYDRETMEWLASTGSRGTGMEMFLVSHGLVGVFLSLLFYIVHFVLNNKNRTAFVFLIFVILLLLQRSYYDWFSWIICYVYGLTYLGSHCQTSKRRIKNELRNTYSGRCR